MEPKIGRYAPSQDSSDMFSKGFLFQASFVTVTGILGGGPHPSTCEVCGFTVHDAKELSQDLREGSLDGMIWVLGHTGWKGEMYETKKRKGEHSQE